MTPNHTGFTEDYLWNTKSVLYAARRLRKVINADRKTRESAIEFLERAAREYETRGMQYQAFMFSELETTAEEDKVTQERLSEDVLASVLTDLQVANLLMAAGRTLGDTDEETKPELFDKALFSLGSTTRIIESSLISPLAEGTVPGRFGFAEVSVIPETIQSVDLQSAIETFTNRSDEVLTKLVNDAQAVVHSVITALVERYQEVVPVTLSKLGEQVQELRKVGRLFHWGIEKLEGAIDTLIRLLGSETLAHIKTQLEKVWQDVQKGKHVNRVLVWLFEVEGTRSLIAEILGTKGLKREALDEGSNAVARLAIKFEENMKMAQRLVTAVTFAGVLTLPLAGPSLTLLLATAYVLILAGVVLIGMDYVDSGGILRRVRGVKEIARGLAS